MSLQRIIGVLLAGVVVVLFAALPVSGDDVEERAKRIEGKLMAPCCMANTLAEHESGASYEMRRDIRAMLRAGQAEREILDHYVARYGAQILSAPEARGFGLAAYVVPFVLLGGGIALMIVMVLRWSRMRAASLPVTEPPVIEPEHAARLLRDLRELD